MPARRRRKNAGTGCARSLGLFAAALLFVLAAFILSCRQNVPTHMELAHPSGRPSAEHRPETSTPKDTPPPTEPTAPSAGETKIQPAPSASSETTGESIDELSRGDVHSSKIALTFDAGADSAPASSILDTLARHGIHATFFLTGRWIERNPDLTRRIAAAGHEIGNHTYSHRRLTTLNAGDITEEAEKTDQLVLKLTGKSTKPLLRVPYGSRDKRVLSTLAKQGYRSIYWDLDSWDSVKVGITSDEIRDRVLGRVRNGSIILMHCGSQATADALDSILQQLLADGYEPVTVSELMRPQ
jgi:peptidoglycan/xylan/chitin deacetylase (PgdA/CDA1 family)